MYEINYEDEQFQKVEAEKQAAIAENNKMYDDMIDQSDDYYQKQIDETRNWTDKQKELQQEQTDLTLKQIEQQKEQAEKDYTKEQKASYVDWQKESNKYGANAEQMAEQGLQNSGYAESSQVSMYNTYQNRVATARESWQTAKQNYDNAMTEAKLQNSATLAEIAYQGLQQELELSLQGFQYKNELLMAKANAKTQILDRYDTQYQAVLDQMNTENALQEKMRQFDQQMTLITSDDEKPIDDGSVTVNLRNTTIGDSGNNWLQNGHKVSTPYFQGYMNPDAEKYGTFGNGYQPKGIKDLGTVSKTGETAIVEMKTLFGTKQNVEREIWKTSDGQKWYWDDSKNSYQWFGCDACGV